MRRYEMGLVVSPTVPENEHDQLITSLETLISDKGGQVLKVDRWGRRKLAYPIRKFTEGNMTFLLFDAEAEVEQEIVRRIKLSDRFLRHLSVRADHEKPPTDEEKEALAEQRKEILRKAEERAKAEAEAAARGETLPDDYDPDAVDEDDSYDDDSRDDSRDDDRRPAKAPAPSRRPDESAASAESSAGDDSGSQSPPAEASAEESASSEGEGQGEGEGEPESKSETGSGESDGSDEEDKR